MKIFNINSIKFGPGSHGDYNVREIITTDALPPIHSFGEVTIDPGQTALKHTHKDNFEIFLVQHGNGKIIFSGTDKKFITEGDCVVTEQGEEHEIINDSKEALVMLYLTIKSG